MGEEDDSMPRKERRRIAEQIRAALLAATQIEASLRPFHLSGRGHESRVTLSVSLAGMVRSIELPRVYIAGFGPKHHYPRRIFQRAVDVLLEQGHEDAARVIGMGTGLTVS